MNRSTALSLALVLVAAPAWAQDEPETTAPPTPAEATVSPELQSAIDGIRRAAPDQRKAAVDAVLALSPSVEDVLTAIERTQPPREQSPGWSVQQAVDEEGVARPYHLYVSELAATADREAPLLVDMHGGVSRPEFVSEAQFAQFRGQWVELADEHGWVLALPLGRGDCTWWSEAGVRHVRATIRDAHRHARIDSDQVLGTGFSDGGSGSYYLAMAQPEPFAAFLPMNGHPVVASRASGKQLYLENARRVPLFVAMTQDDGLYPARNVLPHVQALFDLNVACHLVSYPFGGHTPIYFQEQSDAFASFVESASRGPLAESLEWYAADTATGSVEWLRIDDVGDAHGTLPAPETVNVPTSPGRVVIGIGLDRAYTGPGVRVTEVPEGRPAHEMGVVTGDVIVGIDDVAVAGLADLRRALEVKSHGDPITVTVRREDGDHVLEGGLPAFTSEPSYVRDQPTAHVRVVRDEQRFQVETHHVRRLTLRLTDDMVDLDRPITVTVGSRDAPVATLTHTPGRRLLPILESFARLADRHRLWAAELSLDLTAGASTPGETPK